VKDGFNENDDEKFWEDYKKAKALTKNGGTK